jgi:predicted ester cyclase
MTSEELKRLTAVGFERMFNQGDLDYVDEALAPDAVDHQEPAGAPFPAHLKQVIRTLRTAFPDLHFELHELLCEGDTVACRSTMTGTHQGPLLIGPMASLAVSGARVEVPHMHFFHYDTDGRVTDLWHVWNTLMLARQLGAPAPDLRVTTTPT